MSRLVQAVPASHAAGTASISVRLTNSGLGLRLMGNERRGHGLASRRARPSRPPGTPSPDRAEVQGLVGQATQWGFVRGLAAGGAPVALVHLAVRGGITSVVPEGHTPAQGPGTGCRLAGPLMTRPSSRARDGSRRAVLHARRPRSGCRPGGTWFTSGNSLTPLSAICPAPRCLGGYLVPSLARPPGRPST